MLSASTFESWLSTRWYLRVMLVECQKAFQKKLEKLKCGHIWKSYSHSSDTCTLHRWWIVLVKELLLEANQPMSGYQSWGSPLKGFWALDYMKNFRWTSSRILCWRFVGITWKVFHLSRHCRMSFPGPPWDPLDLFLLLEHLVYQRLTRWNNGHLTCVCKNLPVSGPRDRTRLGFSRFCSWSPSLRFFTIWAKLDSWDC